MKPHYEILFTQIQRLSNGKRFLVDLRSNLLDLLRKNYAASAPPSSSSSTTPPSASLATNQLHHLRAMDANLKTLFQRWFTAPFMDLERITWNSPASVLEKVRVYYTFHFLIIIHFFLFFF